MPTPLKETIGFSSSSCTGCDTPTSYTMSDSGSVVNTTVEPVQSLMSYINHELHGFNRQYLLDGNLVSDEIQLGSDSCHISFLEILIANPVLVNEYASGFIGLRSDNQR